ncbi:MAG: SWIM zinc finger family protein [Haloferacaceae archaeon]
MTHTNRGVVSPPATREKTTLPGDGYTGRARRARTDPMAVRPLRDGRYVVETEHGTYVVALDVRTCTCPDHAIRGARCKHLRRVAIEVSAGRVPPPGERTAVCAVCGGATFVPMGADGPHLCPRHAVDPGALVRDRETGDLLVVVEATGLRADEAETAEGRLVADYDTNDGYGDHEPVFEAVYLDAFDPDDPGRATRYRFPASRLAPVVSDGTTVRESDGGSRSVTTGHGVKPDDADDDNPDERQSSE